MYLPSPWDIANTNIGVPKLPVGMLAHALIGEVQAIAGPIITQGYSSIRSDYFNYNDVAVARSLNYRLNYTSTIRNAAKPLLFGPSRLGAGQLLALFNQLPWHLYDQNPDARFGLWRELEEELRWLGIRLDLPANAGAFNPALSDWQRMIEMGSTPASLDQVIHDYRRGIVSDDEFNFNVQRAGLRRKEDRDRTLNAAVRWPVDDVIRMRLSGIIDEETYGAMFKASGFVRDDDKRIALALQSPRDVSTVLALFRRGQIDEPFTRQLLALAGMTGEKAQEAALQMQWTAPAAPSLLTATVRGAFDNALAVRYGLDQGIDDNPTARYWMKAFGLTGPDGSPAPGAHDGPSDWMKYYWRGSRPIIGFETALELQWRLRPDPANPGQAVQGRGPAWTPANTADSLRMAGYSDTQAAWLKGLENVPINIRLINHILGPFAHHADVRAAAAAAFGADVDWIEGAMLDHGFSAGYAKVASAGIHAQADDREHAERIESEKKQTAQSRELNLRMYSVGTQSAEVTARAITGEQFTADMALVALNLIDKEIEQGVRESHLAAVKEGYMGGKLDVAQVGAQLTAIGITDDRKITYLQEWTWKRSDNPRMLSTGEILGALKRGLLTPQLAMARLTNLGWTQPDALVEIAQVEQELAAAALHRQTAEQAKALAAKLKQERADIIAAKSAVKSSKAAAALAAKKQLQDETAGPLAAEHIAAYNAAALLDRVAYNKAVTAGDADKAQAEINKAQAAFAKLLVQQITLAHESPEIADETPVPPEIQVPEIGGGA